MPNVLGTHRRRDGQFIKSGNFGAIHSSSISRLASFLSTLFSLSFSVAQHAWTNASVTPGYDSRAPNDRRVKNTPTISNVFLRTKVKCHFIDAQCLVKWRAICHSCAQNGAVPVSNVWFKPYEAGVRVSLREWERAGIGLRERRGGRERGSLRGR